MSERDERAGLSEAELMSAECRDIEHDEVADVIDDLLDRLAAAIARAESAEARVAAGLALADWGIGRPTNGVTRMIPADDLRAALTTPALTTPAPTSGAHESDGGGL